MFRKKKKTSMFHLFFLAFVLREVYTDTETLSLLKAKWFFLKQYPNTWLQLSSDINLVDYRDLGWAAELFPSEPVTCIIVSMLICDCLTARFMTHPNQVMFLTRIEGAIFLICLIIASLCCRFCFWGVFIKLGHFHWVLILILYIYFNFLIVFSWFWVIRASTAVWVRSTYVEDDIFIFVNLSVWIKIFIFFHFYMG